MGSKGGRNVRVLVDEAGAVVDLVVDDNVQVLLGSVLRDIGVGEFLVGHGEGVWCWVWRMRACGRGRGMGQLAIGSGDGGVAVELCRDRKRER